MLPRNHLTRFTLDNPKPTGGGARLVWLAATALGALLLIDGKGEQRVGQAIAQLATSENAVARSP
jgi:hypothetical protein